MIVQSYEQSLDKMHRISMNNIKKEINNLVN